ncbi:MAG: proteasome beta subunit [archaeon GW2011_AR4]|nr:MAG: proteasome beta subunit [archaeon GW2011_AR4]
MEQQNWADFPILLNTTSSPTLHSGELLMNDEAILKTGTTTVGIVCEDGIVLAADKRATAGSLIASKKADKVHILNENIALTMAGTVSDAQLLMKYCTSEIKLKELKGNREVLVKEAANLMARMVYSNIRKMSMIPGVAHFIMGGKDSSGYYLFDVFADGSIQLIDDYVSSGSGSVFALGVLDSAYEKKLSVDAGIKLAAKAVNAALQRDIYSGDGLDIVTITAGGVRKVVAKELRVKADA